MKFSAILSIFIFFIGCSAFSVNNVKKFEAQRDIANEKEGCLEILKSLIDIGPSSNKATIDKLFSMIREKNSPLTDEQIETYLYSFYYPHGSIEWKKADINLDRYALPYTGVFNPVTGEVEWKIADRNLERYALPYAGVFNPVTGEVEWRMADRNLERYALPYSGVFNPVTGEVEWRMADRNLERYAVSYSGVFNPVTGKVEWTKDDINLERYAVPFTGVFVPDAK